MQVEGLVGLPLGDSSPGTDCRVLVASQDIEEDEELFAIPRSLVLTTTTSSIPQHVLEPLSDSGPWPPLIVTIIYEYLRRDASPWYPYFQVLPTAFNSLMFWNTQELAQLQASAVVEKIGRVSAEESWKETIVPVILQHPDVFPISGTSDREKISLLMNLAHMAGSLIMAYAFDIDRDDDDDKSQNDPSNQEDEFEEDDEDEPLKGMVPFADMLNADADKNNVSPHSSSQSLPGCTDQYTGPSVPRIRLPHHEIHQTHFSWGPDFQ